MAKGGRWRQPKDPVKSTETCSTKPIPHRNRVDPEVAMENAQSKVARLQKALEAPKGARLDRLEEDQRSRQPRAPPPQSEVRVEQLIEETPS